ncbi:MAG: uL15 family ribosomal protein, partial [Thermodesulfobacteriota bacterium]|nr:uL15 family ribosomal protein [Thermodesulfobacteriota bacterium]
PLQRRLPKRGFANIFKKRIAIVNIGDLVRFDSGTMVDEIALVKAGLVKGKRDGIKVLGKGDLDRPLTIRVNGISQMARVKIEKSGGTVEVV